MRISNIKESGSNNILRWAIANGADIKSDESLKSIINGDTFYLVTLSDVNFFELFRLTQIYREKVRITNEKKAAVPLDEELDELFEVENMHENIINSLNAFLNLIPQMESDNDIIRPSSLRLFIPMLTRRFEAQIPVSFIDLVNTMSEEETSKLFNMEYPATLVELPENLTNGFIMAFSLELVKMTDTIRYNNRFEQYLQITKYSPLKTCKNNKLYKFGIVGFHKFDNIAKGNVVFNMFNPDNQAAPTIFNRLKRLQTPLKVDFAIQLPIQYMQILENSFGRELLTISYESSMKDIINSNLSFDDFITPEAEDSENPDEENESIRDHNNAIEAFRVRISEANIITLNTMNTLLEEGDQFRVNNTAIFSLLPSIYPTKAIITVDSTKKDKYLDINDPVITEMFEEMFEMINDVTYDIYKG